MGAIKEIIGHDFKDRDLLRTALTHSSSGHTYNYERLEFLGDRVLGLVVAEMLYRQFPQEQEGHLAKRLAALVQGRFLARIAAEIKLGDFIEFSDAERQAGGGANENILADVFEALVGALYLDGGYEPCRALIEKLWAGHLHDMAAPPQHPKTALQEWAQGKGFELPRYEVTGQSGPDHMPVFEIRLTVNEHSPVTAQGRSRQEAERQAAQLFIEKNIHE